MMVKKIKSIIKNILCQLPLKNLIVLESYPIFSDNTRIVYEELRRRYAYKDYKFIWIGLNDNEYVPKTKERNTKIIKGNPFTGIGKIICDYYLYRAKIIIIGNLKINKVRDDQILYYLSHGTALKDCSKYYHLPDNIDYCISISSFFKEYDAKNLGVNLEKMKPLGFPRTDCFFDDSHLDLKQLFRDCEFEKTILWMPTFRRHKNGEIIASDLDFPIIHSKQEMINLNNFVKERKLLLIVLPHFSQIYNVECLKDFSNIRVINNNMLLKNNIFLYRIIKETNALLTDYSSIMIDYLMLNKPIGLCWEDYEEYKKNIGFVECANEIFACGVKIYSVNDLYKYIEFVVDDKDVLKSERSALRNNIFDSLDGKSSKRVCDHISSILKN